MNELTRKDRVMHFVLGAAMLLITTGALMLAQTFTHFNDLSLQRQDKQLQDMAIAADGNIAVQLDNIRADLAYVLGRRSFVEAESQWAQMGKMADLLFCMQENLVTQNPLIRNMLALRDGKIFLSADGSLAYTFPDRGEESLAPCFAGDGTIYLALLESTDYAEYAALIDVSAWYTKLAQVHANDQIRLMLLDGREKLLLHQWQNEPHVTAVEELNAENCDIQAVRYMMTSRTSGKALTATYHLTYPGETYDHEMRMTVIPGEESANGYFTVGFTSDYDETVLPMQRAAIQMVIYGGMLILGVLLAVVMPIRMALRERRHNQELQQLRLKNTETQKLLERTQELAHHQRLETLGTLASSIAHEFNNLLTPIMGYSILALERLPEDCDDLAENITEIYEASRKAKTIISRLSDLSRKNVEVTFHPLLLENLVVKAMQIASPAQPAHVNTVVRCDAECRIEGNETQLSQMLLNLILNAYHAMQGKGGTLTLSLVRGAGQALLRVEDTGTGIPAEAIPHIFEPFYTTKESGCGTGLGLAIVQQVAESHHGDITVESQPGQGTIFTVRFPLVEDSMET